MQALWSDTQASGGLAVPDPLGSSCAVAPLWVLAAQASRSLWLLLLVCRGTSGSCWLPHGLALAFVPGEPPELQLRLVGSLTWGTQT